mmetsp:Transcript_16661/g.18863  ORF Transcript_16661/g.18863 Transcript_16661/m.18863 type:complete len:657 (-) Transcript_16661:906-2876(-)|eukprot:CAMPEP_0184012666 /NCGR_PEP_ID=MMETSP0954-20121128/4559_1 /TAXON_ID=627963 /ORGANISM="Aplanochytrium sp, Strain PBS07" /LENGTH=656 /DNA_ID=CAMNT_0026292719 /DNA_START=209 /DNA_END=2179 /DNA_ORIENTATION=+
MDDEWVPRTDPRTGRTYYYNKALKQTSWHKPDNTAPGADTWVEKVDKNGKTFYFNPITKVRSMVDPTGGNAASSPAARKPNMGRVSMGRVSRGSSFSGRASFSARSRGASFASSVGGRRRQSVKLTNSLTGSLQIPSPIQEDRFAKLNALAGIDPLAQTASEPEAEREEDDLTQYDWEKWGMNNFNYKKDKLLDGMLNWSNVPLKKSLHKLSTGKLEKQCVEVFKYIQMFMDDFNGKKKLLVSANEAVKRILMIPLNDSPDEVRDEVLCQMIKQVSNNPIESHEVRGWQLLSLAVGFFPPGVFFEPYLRRFIDVTRGSTANVEVQQYAQYAKLRLDKAIEAGPRAKAPSDDEIDCTMNRKAVAIPVFFINGQQIKMSAESWTTIGNLKDAVGKLLGIKDTEVFCVAEVGDDMSEYALPDTERVLDVISDWEEEYRSFKNPADIVTNKFVFKLRLFVEIDSTDDAAVDLAYFQAVYDVTDSRYPITQKDAVRLIALQAQEMYGNYAGTDPFGPDFIKFLPSSVEPSQGLRAQIIHQYEQLSGMDGKEAKIQYLNYVQGWEHYGCQVFPVSPENNPKYPDEIYLAVNARGVFIIDPKDKTDLDKFEWDYIMNWGNSEETFCLVLGDFMQQAKLWFRTEQPVDIRLLVESYGVRIKKDR